MITAVKLENFKCFAKLLIPFGPLTLLSGINAMGKSSLLHALLLLRQSRYAPFPGGLLRTLQLNGQLVRLGTAADIYYENATEDTIGIGVNFGGKETNWSVKYRSPIVTTLKLVSVPRDMSFLREPLFRTRQFWYLQAERLGPRTSFRKPNIELSASGYLGTQGENTAHYISVHGRTPVANNRVHHKAASSMQLKDQIEAWMSEVTPGTRIETTAYDKLDLVELRYAFVNGQFVSNSYRAINVGFGITYTLPVIVALLAAHPGDLVMMENPEAHLHPRGQTMIGGLVARAASGGVQVVIETHSDHVLNGIRLAVRNSEIQSENVFLHYLKRKADTGPIECDCLSPKIDANGRIDQWPHGFLDEWERSLEELIKPREES